MIIFALLVAATSSQPSIVIPETKSSASVLQQQADRYEACLFKNAVETYAQMEALEGDKRPSASNRSLVQVERAALLACRSVKQTGQAAVLRADRALPLAKRDLRLSGAMEGWFGQAEEHFRYQVRRELRTVMKGGAR